MAAERALAGGSALCRPTDYWSAQDSSEGLAAQTTNVLYTAIAASQALKSWGRFRRLTRKDALH